MIDLKKYPTATVKYKQFIKELITKMQEDMMKGIQTEHEVELPPITDDVVEGTMTSVLEHNIRILYNFFDSNELYIGVNVIPSFYYSIKDNVVSDTMYSSREECELEAFKKGFEILNEKV